MQSANELPAVQSRKKEIEDNQPGLWRGAKLPKCFVPVGGMKNPVAIGFEDLGERLSPEVVLIDEEDGRRRSPLA